jgi:transposase, IS5 family
LSLNAALLFHICRREHQHQLSFEDFFLPFGGKLSVGSRWNKLAELIPWDEREDDYAAQFCKGFGAPAKPFRIALVALIIKARLGLTDEELVEQIKENPYPQFFIGLEAFHYSAPFDPSMMVYFRKRLPEAVVNDCNEGIVRHGLKVIRAFVCQNPVYRSCNGCESASTGKQPIPSAQNTQR